MGRSSYLPRGPGRRRAPAPGEAHVPRWTLAAAGLLPVTLVTGWLTADAVQPDAYSPVRQSVSVLAGHAGTHRWIMTGALVVIGSCYLGLAVGLAAVAARARFGLAAAGVAAFGIVVSPEPMHGSTPQHLFWTGFGELVIAAWPILVVGERQVLPRRWTVGAAVVSVALLVWLTVQVGGGRHLGLAERATASLQATWPLVVALSLRRSVRPSPPPAR